ncbi:MAG: hypothetical protein IKP72_06225 [Clostridia bacterium]|nr:hypothetical protein [Clostridia bacterium]
MKKLVSLFVALCMVFMMIPALAETVSEDPPMGEQTTEQEADMGELLGLMGGLLGGEAGEGEEGADLDLSALLGALLGGVESETKSIETVYAAAETKEQFFGTWNLTKATIFDVPVTLEDVASLLEIPLTLQVIVADGSFAMVAEGEPKPEEVTMELVDGALNLTQEGDETMVLKLTDAGELVMEIGFVSLYFVPAPVAAE